MGLVLETWLADFGNGIRDFERIFKRAVLENQPLFENKRGAFLDKPVLLSFACGAHAKES